MYNFKTLSNGLTVITAPRRGTAAAAALVMVGTGSKYEKKEESGLSHFLEHMFFKGSKKRPSALKISSALDGLGAEYNAFTGKEYTGYWVKTEAGRLAAGLDVLSDMLLNPVLAAAEIERERGVIIEEINMYRDNPLMRIEDVFEELLYGDTPAGRDTAGTKASVARLKRADFADYLGRQYGPANTVLCFAGAISPAPAARLAARFFPERPFGRRGADFREKEPVRERTDAPRARLEYKKTDQAHLMLGARAYGYSHPDKLVVRLLAIILGGSMSSRLFLALRERRGLAYYVRAQDELYTDCGYVAARAGVPVDKLNEAARIIIAEFRRLKRAPAGPAELKRAKDFYRGRIALQLESADDLAGWYGRQAVMKLQLERRPGAPARRLNAPADFFRALDRVTAADIRRVARDIFQNEKLNLAVIGPYRNNSEAEKMLSL